MPQSDFWQGINKPVDDGNPVEASLLQKQLGAMEGEVKEIQMELAAIRRNRYDTHNLKLPKESEPAGDADKVVTSYNRPTQLNTDEKVIRFSEISKLREELIRAKNAVDEEKFQREKYDAKLKDLELKLNNISSGGRTTEIKESQQYSYSDSEFAVLKTQIRDMKEETEELKISLTEKSEQLQEYRVKYLQAQQQVEELKRQMDVIDFDNKQVSDQIHLEIQKMKMQFQEKLQELAPLPDLLKGAQIQLQEAKQFQKLAEDSTIQLSIELQRVKEKLVTAMSNLNEEKAEKARVIEENKDIHISLDDKQIEIDNLFKNIDDSSCQILRLKEKLSQQEIRIGEKSAECGQLLADMEELRDESSRSLSRCKERADSMRRNFQTQISELERQLIQSRAQCRACQKDRDEIRQRMQIQINGLQENFELVVIKLRALHNQVASLKNNYAFLLSDEGENRNEFGIITPAS